MPSPDKFDFTLEPRQLRARVRALETLVLTLYAYLDLRPGELKTLFRQISDKRAEPKAIRQAARGVAAAVLKKPRQTAARNRTSRLSSGRRT